ncbi:MAG: DUF4149 domain-containing protein [Pseudomonadota bacterium]
MARLRVLLPALWAGVLLCIALVATPAPFATLTPADAGRVVGRIFAQEAYFSLVVAVALFLMERRIAAADAAAGRGSAMSTNVLLLLGTLFCTVAGYFALQPLMAAARAGQGGPSFAVLHGVSAGFFGLKTVLVCALSWRTARPSAL